ncbi:hypothetical protein GGI20_002854 [Coemansia sp. BCRC 34301]|nr:hypothetical protein GGI20_002854 [Coemansia sp. BCRC 34301]
MSSATLAALLESVHSEDPDSLSPSSKRIQDSFVCSDLLAIDSSNGAVKRRIRAWFASGKIWQAAFMRVYEVSDSLVDDAIHERSLEEAEFGMIHATGRLNEYARHTASALASKLGCLHQDGSLGALDAGGHTEAELVSARNALRALAAQSEAVDSLVLARIVWEARESLVGTDKCLDRIPAYIRWSLAQSWTINAGAIAGAIASVMYYNIPIIYAASGGLALSLLALVWLAARGARGLSTVKLEFTVTKAETPSIRPPLVILHGLFGSKQNWRAISKQLSRTLGRDTYSVDLRNHGDSPHMAPHTYEAMSADIVRFIGDHCLGAPVLVGHSMGGKVVMRTALDRPDLVSQLIVDDIVPCRVDLAHDFGRYVTGLRDIESRDISSQKEADALLAEVEDDISVRQFLLTNMKKSKDSLGGVKGAYKSRIPLELLGESLSGIVAWDMDPQRIYPGPTLFIGGEKSPYVKPYAFPAMRQHFPAHKVAMLDTGHWVHAEMPQEFMDLINDFVTSH